MNLVSMVPFCLVLANTTRSSAASGERCCENTALAEEARISSPRTVRGSGSRGSLLLRILRLCLVNLLLHLVELVLVVLSLLCRRYRSLVGDSVNNAKGKGGPPQNLETAQLAHLFR
jgi:hypothetical protein